MPSNTPAYDAAQILVASSLVTASASWPYKIGKLSTSPDQQVALADAPGQPANPRWLLDYPAIVILVRGTPNGYPVAWAKGKAIKDRLLGMDAVTLSSGDRWDSVTMMSDLNYLGPDENDRPIFSLNFRLIIEPALANSALTSRESL